MTVVMQPPIPAGVIHQYAGASAPAGYLMCDGSAVSRTTYADLFAALGTTYGAGNGSTTFNVPDLRGRVPVGSGNDSTTPNNATRTLGSTGGDTRLQSHTHAGSTATGYANIGIPGVGLWGQQPIAWYNGWSVDAATYTAGVQRPVTDFGHSHSFTTGDHNQSVGAGANMPPFTVVNHIIKT